MIGVSRRETPEITTTTKGAQPFEAFVFFASLL
jgi:hypothetical protein